MYQKLKVIHNNLSIKLEKLEKANNWLFQLSKNENVSLDVRTDISHTNLYDITIVVNENARIEAMILNIMIEAGCVPYASGLVELGVKKMLFTLYI